MKSDKDKYLDFSFSNFIPEIATDIAADIRQTLEHCSQCKQNAFRINQYLDMKIYWGIC